jgi:hypothetical protein
MTLHDVEAVTRGEFKAASLSAYERGERVISVLRLVRLATIYQTAFVDLVPALEQPELEPLARATPDARRLHPVGTDVGAAFRRVRFDMVRIAELDGPGWEQARNVLVAVQQRRHGRAGRFVTVRNDDLCLLASIFGVTARELVPALVRDGVVRAD